MKLLLMLLLGLTSLSVLADAAPPKKKPKAPVKPQPTVKDLANAEARKHDQNHDGKISGPEVSMLRAVWPTNPKSWLYLFDDNDNGRLDDAEIAAIRFKPSPKPSASGTKKTQPKKSKR